MNYNITKGYYLVVIQTKERADNVLRAVRKIFSEFEKITDKVYLVPENRWNRIKFIVPRSGITLYYTKSFKQIIYPEEDYNG